MGVAACDDPEPSRAEPSRAEPHVVIDGAEAFCFRFWGIRFLMTFADQVKSGPGSGSF